MRQNAFHKIGIVGKYGSQQHREITLQVLEFLQQHALDFWLDTHSMPPDLQTHPKSRPMAHWKDLDVALVIGGDGSFLNAARNLRRLHIPLIGINAGRLGFLADLSASDLHSQLHAVLIEGAYYQEMRPLLAVRIQQDAEIRGEFFAVNDAVIHKRTMARMVELNVYADAHFLCHYHADGLILSTPTGSTAYALSAGGPIVEPTLDVILIAPICPHTLNHRPMVLSAQKEIQICPGKESQDIQLTIDGQEEFLLQPEDRIRIRHGGNIAVLHPANYQFQRRLREKFNWGMSPELV